MSSLMILGIEVVQTIQCFDHKTGSKTNNSVPLVANKKTLVRVYVGSDDEKEIGNVTGSLKVGTKTIDPINKAITARPAKNIDRNKWDHTLNFLINPSNDLALSDDVEIVPTVWEKEDGNKTIEYAETFTFQSCRNPVPKAIIIDVPGLEPLPLSDYAKTLEGVRMRYPVAEGGFLPLDSLDEPLDCERINIQDLDIDIDLKSPVGWEDLLNVIYDKFDDTNRICAAIVPNVSYGKFDVSGFGDVGKTNTGTTAFLVKATLSASFAHEMGHSFGQRDWHDNSELPKETEDIGWKPDENGIDPLILSGAIELMISGYDEKRWPSIKFYKKIFNQLYQK